MKNMSKPNNKLSKFQTTKFKAQPLAVNSIQEVFLCIASVHEPVKSQTLEYLLNK